MTVIRAVDLEEGGSLTALFHALGRVRMRVFASDSGPVEPGHPFNPCINLRVAPAGRRRVRPHWDRCDERRACRGISKKGSGPLQRPIRALAWPGAPALSVMPLSLVRHPAGQPAAVRIRFRRIRRTNLGEGLGFRSRAASRRPWPARSSRILCNMQVNSAAASDRE